MDRAVVCAEFHLMIMQWGGGDAFEAEMPINKDDMNCVGEMEVGETGKSKNRLGRGD